MPLGRILSSWVFLNSVLERQLAMATNRNVGDIRRTTVGIRDDGQIALARQFQELV
jgi:hypothetical protein